MTRTLISRMFLVAVSLLIFSGIGMAEDNSSSRACLKWDVKTGQTVNKRQSARLYLEAARWVESKFPSEAKVRPCITVHVGDSCPAQEVGSICVSPVSGDLYLPTWQEGSPAVIAQATVMTAMIQLVDRDEVRKLAGLLLAEDRRDFYDALAAK